ncbi:MAG: hypothetical protein Q4A15_00935 [Prevotellaceae bacterium]|nr:hypothetical protein [Prevotellaceae bacterium]
MKQYVIKVNVPTKIWAIDESLLEETGKKYLTKYVDMDPSEFREIEKIIPGYTENVEVMAASEEDALKKAQILFEENHSVEDVNYSIIASHDRIQETIYMFYMCDQWLMRNSRELVYIGTDLEDGIAQIQAYRGCTEEQAKQIRENMQSQCTDVDYEWIVEEVRTNAFVD